MESLAYELSAVAENEFKGFVTGRLRMDGFTTCTRLVKETFARFARSKGFKVAAAGVKEANDGEWLYDLVCYEEAENGLLTSVPIIVESEWGVRVSQSTQVDCDFQKLVQARANVRVWVTAIANRDLARQHIENCKNQARSFSLRLPDDQYVFVVFLWADDSLIVERFSPSDREPQAALS